MAYHVNRPITAQLEVHYAQNKESGNSKIVGTLLRVHQGSQGSDSDSTSVNNYNHSNSSNRHEYERKALDLYNGAEGSQGAFAEGSAPRSDRDENGSLDTHGHRGGHQIHSLETSLSNSMKVCDFYQCVHSHHYHHHDDWFVHIPACARRFSESNLARLPIHFQQLKNQEALDAQGTQSSQGSHMNPDHVDESRQATYSTPRRVVSCSTEHADLAHANVQLTSVPESEQAQFNLVNPFRKHYNLASTEKSPNPPSIEGHSDEDSYERLSPMDSDPMESDNGSISNNYNSSTPPESIHACRIDNSSNPGSLDDETNQASLDLSSPCTKHHHRRNSLAVIFKKPRFKSV
ncbi:YMR206W [Kluyveromyces marxianus]|uniref:YMR206W n=1 Tax=Kluyveromyces marxianus TaxID=4911 RepID=A0ABX6EYD1_KLUMA|nr:YMR206W [Kluyveromyces marxianus]